MTTHPSIVTYPINVLVSYHYFKNNADRIIRLHDSGAMRFIADSGSFSAHQLGAKVSIPDYVTWCRYLGGRLHWCASLDVIGDPRASWDNWTRIRDKHQLLTVPTVHAGTETSWLDAYTREGVDLIGLGGMAGLGQAPRAYRWVVNMVRHARDHHPHIRFHLWGITGFQFLETLPVWSADSSGFLGNAYRWAITRVFDPTTKKVMLISLRRDAGNSIYKIGPLLRREYGLDPAIVKQTATSDKSLASRLATGSSQRYADWLQTRHRVTAPVTYQGDATIGPQIYVVTVSISYLEAMLDSEHIAKYHGGE